MDGGRLIECVPNFSEGRDPVVLAEIANSIRETQGVDLLDHSADPDHNRSVFTFVGSRDAVVSAALDAARVAVERIDLTGHAGVHPRIGAIDVVPFVPLGRTEMATCVETAHDFGRRLWSELQVPSFFYEFAAERSEFRALENLRRLARGGATPDVGRARHATAGASAVGARNFLIAWNIWLDTSDLEVAKQIARAVRFSSGGLPGVKALGLPLESLGLVQVSINTTDFRATPLDVLFDRVGTLASQAGVAVRGSELIGMIPRSALDLSAGSDLRWLNLTPDRILETG